MTDLTSLEPLRRLLRAEGVVEIPREAWAGAAAAFAVLERHATGLAGDLVVARGPDGLVLVETPEGGERVVVRALADEGEVRHFVSRRLAQYERMWDG